MKRLLMLLLGFLLVAHALGIEVEPCTGVMEYREDTRNIWQALVKNPKYKYKIGQAVKQANLDNPAKKFKIIPKTKGNWQNGGLPRYKHLKFFHDTYPEIIKEAGVEPFFFQEDVVKLIDNYKLQYPGHLDVEFAKFMGVKQDRVSKWRNGMNINLEDQRVLSFVKKHLDNLENEKIAQEVENLLEEDRRETEEMADALLEELGLGPRFFPANPDIPGPSGL